MGLLTHPSPNFGERKEGALPDIVVIHYTAMNSAEGALRALSNLETEVSAHYLIARTGEVMSLVAEDKRAWHAGAGQWGAVTDVNSSSIGIELDNDGVSPFSAPLMEALEELLAAIMQRWAIRPERVIAHSDLAPGRKIDPGLRFDWQRLARQGLAVWPELQQADASTFLSHAHGFGYRDDLELEVVLDAFRRRFRPWANGPVNALDAGLAADLAGRFPVDRAPLTS